MSENNLFDELFAAEVEQTELEQLVGAYFKSAMQLTSNEIVYPSHEREYALRLKYDDDVLAEIVPGANLTPNDIGILKERIKNHLLSSDGTRMGRVFLFTAVPVDGYFRLRNFLDRKKPTRIKVLNSNTKEGEHARYGDESRRRDPATCIPNLAARRIEKSPKRRRFSSTMKSNMARLII
jgi:hypothetical protein